jgi:hypothetical protein
MGGRGVCSDVSFKPLVLRGNTGMARGKRERGKRRLAELMKLSAIHGFDVHAFSPIHVRVHGDIDVDYWPTTGKAWVVGSSKSLRGEPTDVIELASTGSVVEQRAAEAHMRAIVNDDGPPPWE